MMRSEESIIKGLGDAIFEALSGMYIHDGSPPYDVPYAIQGDMWKFTRADSLDEAINLIHDAVRDATESRWNRYGRTDLATESHTSHSFSDSACVVKSGTSRAVRARLMPRHRGCQEHNHENL